MKQWFRLIKLSFFILLTYRLADYVDGSMKKGIVVTVLLLAIFFFVLFPREMEVQSFFEKTKKPLNKKGMNNLDFPNRILNISDKKWRS